MIDVKTILKAVVVLPVMIALIAVIIGRGARKFVLDAAAATDDFLREIRGE